MGIKHLARLLALGLCLTIAHAQPSDPTLIPATVSAEEEPPPSPESTETPEPENPSLQPESTPDLSTAPDQSNTSSADPDPAPSSSATSTLQSSPETPSGPTPSSDPSYATEPQPLPDAPNVETSYPLTPASSPPPSITPAANSIPTACPSSPDLPIPPRIKVKSLDLRDTDIREAFESLAKQYQVTIIAGPEVSGKVTIRLHQMPLQDALRLIAEEQGYCLSAFHGAVKVARPAPQSIASSEPVLRIDFRASRLSLDAKQVPADELARAISLASSRNIVYAGTPQPLSAFFKDLDLSQALTFLAQANGLALRQEDGIFTLSPAGPNPQIAEKSAF